MKPWNVCFESYLHEDANKPYGEEKTSKPYGICMKPFWNLTCMKTTQAKPYGGGNGTVGLTVRGLIGSCRGNLGKARQVEKYRLGNKISKQVDK